MGKIEKVVVMSVLMLMVVITAVTWMGSEENQPQDKPSELGELSERGGRLRSNDRGDLGSVGSERWRGGSTASRQDLGEQGRKRPVAPDLKVAQVKPATTEGLLSAPVRQGSTQRQMEAAKARMEKAKRANSRTGQQPNTAGLRKPTLEAAQAPGVDPSWTLVRADGLSNTINPAYKTYRCKNGDTFERVALLYYGDKRHAHFLRRNNEGVHSLAKGQILHMPTVNEMPLANTYMVREGDSLWSIAKDAYKAGHRWNEIYDANRHVLRSPDDLRQGLELTIP